MSPGSVPLAGAYDSRLVLLSLLIAVLASGPALDLAGWVSASRGPARARVGTGLKLSELPGQSD